LLCCVELTVDPDYTYLAMTRFSEGFKLFWGRIFGQVWGMTSDVDFQGKEIRELMINPMTKFLKEDIKEFKVLRM